jgi:hypothetical protein
VQLSPAPGTGLQSPETGSQNRRYRDLSRRQRPHVPHSNPRNARKLWAIRQRPGNIGSHRTAWWGRQDSNLPPDRYLKTSEKIRPHCRLRGQPSRVHAKAWRARITQDLGRRRRESAGHHSDRAPSGSSKFFSARIWWPGDNQDMPAGRYRVKRRQHRLPFPFGRIDFRVRIHL